MALYRSFIIIIICSSICQAVCQSMSPVHLQCMSSGCTSSVIFSPFPSPLPDCSAHAVTPCQFEYLNHSCYILTKLRTSQSNQLIFPPVRLVTYGPRLFAVAGPTIWNNLPEYLHDPELSIDNFRRQLKTFLFAQY